MQFFYFFIQIDLYNFSELNRDNFKEIKNTLINISERLYECYNNYHIDESNDIRIINYSCSIECHNYNNLLTSELRRYSPGEIDASVRKEFQ
ncbi:hypothetical protein COU57_04465 [Candidatus Pacearchaeota archaeon CG10_big_fil_rev_8_21_14_0_10_32_14]|nr:MAG: hypothetical protein COU57_04465 [Candidatus Pacearchaeota archaeon CG10_big_fil_rev_8_21_14_0_10_32_14]